MAWSWNDDSIYISCVDCMNFMSLSYIYNFLVVFRSDITLWRPQTASQNYPIIANFLLTRSLQSRHQALRRKKFHILNRDNCSFDPVVLFQCFSGRDGNLYSQTHLHSQHLPQSCKISLFQSNFVFCCVNTASRMTCALRYKISMIWYCFNAFFTILLLQKKIPSFY